MKTINCLEDYLRIILGYEFNTGCYGLVTSEYTDDIITYESKRLSRHRKTLDLSKPCLFIRGAKNIRLVEFNDFNEAVLFASGVWGDTYIIYQGDVTIPMIYESGVELISITNMIGENA